MARDAPDVEIIWRAYELRPEPAPALDPGGEYLRRAWASSVYPLAAQLGMTMKLPPVQPRSRLAHEAARWARSLARFDDYNAAVFRAFFERGEDIGRTEILLGLAQTVGLPQEPLRSALASHEFEAGVIDDEREAQVLGIRGVPAFVVNRQAALSGVQTVPALKALIDRARSSADRF